MNRPRAHFRYVAIESLEDRRLLSINQGAAFPSVAALVTGQPAGAWTSSASAEVQEAGLQGSRAFDPANFQPMPLPDPRSSGTAADAGQLVSYDVATGRITYHEALKADPNVHQGQVEGEDGAVEYPPASEQGVQEDFTDLSIISDPSPHPWRVNVKTFQTFPNGQSFVCSGTLIDPSHVLTAGHCVFRASRGGWVSSMRVVPAYDNGAQPYGDAVATQLHSWTGWTQDEDFDDDIGVIDLNRPIGALTGWHGYGYNDDPGFYTGNTFHNPGYPAEAPYNGEDMYYWFGNYDYTDTFLGIWTGNEVGINSRSYGGQSGSGSYYIDGGSRYLYSVLSNGNDSDTYFPRITSDKFGHIRDQFIADDTPSAFDLIPLNVQVSPPTTLSGGPLSSMSYLVHNYSSAGFNGTVNVSVYLSTNDIISTFDQLIQNHSFSYNFGAKSSVTVNVTSPPTIPTSVAGGNYWIGVILDIADNSSANNDSSGQDAAPIAVVQDDHGNCSASTLIAADSTTNGSLQISSDEDCFSFYANAGAQVSLETALGSLNDSTLTLYDTDGVTQLVFDDDGGPGLASHIDYTFSFTGRYFAKVASFSSLYSGSYSLALSHVDDYGESPATSTYIAGGSVTSGTIEVGGDRDWFYLNAATGAQVTLETTLGTLSDSIMRIYDSDGVTELAFDDDSGIGLASRIDYTFVAGGAFYVEITEFGAPNGPGTYSLSFSYVDDHGNGPASATLISVIESVTAGTLEVSRDEDWFAFDADAGTSIVLATNLGSLGDSTLTLYDVNGTTELAFDDDGGPGLASRIEYTVPASGRYYVKVRGFGASHVGTYDLVFNFLTALPGDFDNDGAYTCVDINALVGAIAAGTNNPTFDLTGDLLVNLLDRDSWLSTAGAFNLGPGKSYLLGDGNLSGAVDGSDFGVWNANKFTTGAGWCGGDFNANGATDGSDFGIWNANKFQTSDAIAVPVKAIGAWRIVSAQTLLTHVTMEDASGKFAQTPVPTPHPSVPLAVARPTGHPVNHREDLATSVGTDEPKDKSEAARRADLVFAHWMSRSIQPETREP